VVDARFDDPDPHWRQGVEWQPLCGNINTTYDPCFSVTGDGGPPPAPPPKSSNLTYEDRGANPFTVTADFRCSPAAFAEKAQDLGAEALSRLESYEVENTFWTGVAGGQPIVYPHLAADAEVTEGVIHPVLLQTAATPVTGAVLNIVEALGLLEQALADCYNGVGVIHVPAVLGPLLAAERLVERDGRRLRTAKGNLVALGNGYPGTGPDGSDPAPGTAWIYATGAVFAYRSGVEVMPLPSIVNRSDNTVEAIAERTYVLGWDCCHFAVQVGASPFLGSDSGLLEAADFQAAAPLSWDAGTETVSLEPGSDGQYLATDGSTVEWRTPGEPGAVAGPLDGSGHIPASQLPPQPLHETFEAASEAEMLAASVSAPAVCIRTDFTPAHLFYLHTDPASDINNWEDLGAGVSAGADPTAEVGLTAVNGIASTYMRSDAAPALSEAIVPTWTGKHTFNGGVQVPTGAAAGRVLTSDGSGNASWAAVPVTSVNAKTGAVVLNKGDVGLGNVDNTSDAAKPISTATQAALDTKFTTPTPLISKVVFGTTLSSNVPGLVGYDQDVQGDTLAMRTFTGTLKTATPAANDDAATKEYVDDAVAAGGTAAWGSITGTLSAQSDLNTALAARVLTADKASQAQAEAGTDDTKWMTPLKVAQAINAQVHGGPAQDVDTYVLTTDQNFNNATGGGVGDFSQIVLADDKTQVRLIEGTLYISGAHEAGIRWWFTNVNSETITFNGSAVMAASSGQQMVFNDYNPTEGANQGFEADPADAQIRPVTFSLFVTSTPTAGSYGSLLFAAAQQTSFGSPVTIHAGSRITSRLLSST
jgi:hypothetical protein